MKSTIIKIIAVLIVLLLAIYIYKISIPTKNGKHSHAVWHIKGTSSTSLSYNNENYLLSLVATGSGRLSDSIFVREDLTTNRTAQYSFQDSLCLDTLNHRLCFLELHLMNHTH